MHFVKKYILQLSVMENLNFIKFIKIGGGGQKAELD